MINYILWAVLFISLLTDLRSRKILNWITLPTIGAGLLYHTWANGWTGFLYSGEGLVLGLGFLIIPYLLGGMGAGDVKLLAAIGSLMGPSFMFSSFLYICLVGGSIALFILLFRGELGKSLQRIWHALFFLRTGAGSLQVLDRSELHHAFPYGVAIVFGTLAAQLWGGY